VAEWRDVASDYSAFSPVLPIPAGSSHLDVSLSLGLDWTETGSYEYSKLYWRRPDQEFSEERVICFRVPSAGTAQRVRLELPPELKEAGASCFRLDPLAYMRSGAYCIEGVDFVCDPLLRDAASVLAALHAIKQRTRARVAESEMAGNAPHLRHFPESLSIELTPRCNLRCRYCSSHRTASLHSEHNKMPEMQPETLRRLATQAFPYATTVSLVGRGEPLLVSQRLWQTLQEEIDRHSVLLSFVTNGLLVERRVTADLMTHIDTITVSIDGGTEKTMGTNRVGAALSKVVHGIEYLNQLRRSVRLARRPRLFISWTLLKNNVDEFVDFVDRSEAFSVDGFYVRHLMVYDESLRHESLLSDRDKFAPQLSRAYEILQGRGVKTDFPMGWC